MHWWFCCTLLSVQLSASRGTSHYLEHVLETQSVPQSSNVILGQSRVEIAITILLHISSTLPHLKCCSAELPFRAELIHAYIDLSGFHASTLSV